MTNTINESYVDILEQAKTEHEFIDYTALRQAYTKTPSYSPYNDRSVFLYREKMFSALNRQDYNLAIRYAQNALNINFLNIEAHTVMYKANQALRKHTTAVKHKAIAEKLLKSILNSGDGHTPATAYKVISVQEQYVVIEALGGATVKQVLINNGNGRYYDVHEIIKPGSSVKEKVYFDISLPCKALISGSGKQLSEYKVANRIKDIFKALTGK